MTTNAPLRDHAYDGIQEFDNRLPNWWLWTFYLACIFSVGYWIHYQTLGTGADQMAAYLAEEAAGKARVDAEMAKNPISDEILQKLAREPATVAAGRQFYLANCVVCHKEDGSGFVGPNLTDEYWLYGGTPMAIYESVMEGRPGGMQPWKSHGRSAAQEVVAYLLTIRGTNRPGKEPQGKKEGG